MGADGYLLNQLKSKGVKDTVVKVTVGVAVGVLITAASSGYSLGRYLEKNDNKHDIACKERKKNADDIKDLKAWVVEQRIFNKSLEPALNKWKNSVKD